MKKEELWKLSHPLFIASIILLLFNDFYLKPTYGNVITGKLSDFTGLFAFPFFLSCIFPQYKKDLHVITFFLFILWKSSLCQPFIDLVNSVGIPVTRVVDFSDNIALISIFISYYFFNRENKRIELKPVYTWSIIFVSSFSFMATSLPPKTIQSYTDVNKTYKFEKPIEYFIADFNLLQQKEAKLLDKYKINYTFNPDDGTYIHSESKDTLLRLVRLEGDRKDTIKVRSYFADYWIYENQDSTTMLELKNIINISENTGILGAIFPGKTQAAKIDKYIKKAAYIDNSENTPFSDNHIRYVNDTAFDNNKLVKQFEKRLVKKLR